MIGTIDVNIQAARPDFPLTPFKAFVNSPSSVRVRNVPKKIGKWDVTKVYVNANYPDNMVRSAECVLTAGIWVGTIAASTSVGTSLNGYTITADGTDENGTAVTGYILGKGDVEILDADGTITPAETTYYLHILPSAPTTPKQGDAYVDGGTWWVYNGSAWTTLGGTYAGNGWAQWPTSEGGDNKWHRVIISQGAIAYDEQGVDEPPTGHFAIDSQVVHNSGNETIAGTKTFSSAIVGNLTGDVTGNVTGHASQDALDSAAVHKSGNETIAGLKKFSDTPLVGCIAGTGKNTTITSNSNLNTIAFLGVGTYTCPSNAVAASLSNSPTDVAFTMYVFAPHGGSIGDETTIPYCDRVRLLFDLKGRYWTQCCKSVVTAGEFDYSAWKKVSTDDEVVKTTGDQSISGTKTFNSGIIYTPSIPFVLKSNNDIGPSSTTESSRVIRMKGVNNENGSILEFKHWADGTNGVGIFTVNDDGEWLGGLHVKKSPTTNKAQIMAVGGNSVVKGSAFAEVGMPNLSNKIDLTLPSEQGGLITPSSQYNGWVMMTATTPNPSQAENGIAILYAGTNLGVQCTKSASGNAVRIILPVSRGQAINVWWRNCTIQSFQFIKVNAEVA